MFAPNQTVAEVALIFTKILGTPKYEVNVIDHALDGSIIIDCAVSDTFFRSWYMSEEEIAKIMKKIVDARLKAGLDADGFEP